MDSTLKLAKDWAINNLIVEMDSSVAILFLKEGYSYNLNHDGKLLWRGFRGCKIKHCFREVKTI